MYRPTFSWGRFQKWHRGNNEWVERAWVMLLFVAAVILFGMNLGGLPLRDWDEGTVAQVAREIWRSPNPLIWLHPTLGGESYLNKPPLMHLLIAFAYKLGGVNEWTTRLPGAMLSAISVPLLYAIGREIFRQRLSAIFSALTYLTMLPLVRHGRLAMLDGAVVCFFLFMMWCLLRARRNLRYCLGVGIGFGLICFTKGLLGLLLGAIAFLFLLWDTPRLLTTSYLWLGILIGSAPVALWYVVQLLQHGQNFTEHAIINQSLRRVWAPVENHAQPPWYYFLEICKYTWPWLLFLPQGFSLTKENLNLSWAKLVMVWGGVYLLAISLMVTKLPWYVLPIYPALALAIGAKLAQAWYQVSYPRAWVAVLTLIAVVGWVGSFYYSPWSLAYDWEVQLILTAVAGTMTLASILAKRGDRQFLLILFWGMYVSLLLLMTSHHWVWELAEAYPVKPVAAVIKSHTPTGTTVYTSFPDSRPSLNFYSDRQIIPLETSALQQYWKQEQQPYLLVDESAMKKLNLESVKLGQAEGWTLITKEQGQN